MDLFWTYNGRVPSEEEYYRMVDQSESDRLFVYIWILTTA